MHGIMGTTIPPPSPSNIRWIVFVVGANDKTTISSKLDYKTEETKCSNKANKTRRTTHTYTLTHSNKTLAHNGDTILCIFSS